MLCVRFDLQLAGTSSLSPSRFLTLLFRLPVLSLSFYFSLFHSFSPCCWKALPSWLDLTISIYLFHILTRMPDYLQCTLVLSRSLVFIVGAVSSGSTCSSRVSILLILWICYQPSWAPLPLEFYAIRRLIRAGTRLYFISVFYTSALMSMSQWMEGYSQR